MDLSFLAALDGWSQFPYIGILVFIAWLYISRRLVSAGEKTEAIERMERAHAAEMQRVREDRDERLEGKNEEIARMTAAHDAEVSRAREAEQEWRNAWRESQDIAAEVRSQNRDLVDSLYYVRKVVGALPS